MCKVATEYCPELRLYILDRPYLNATMAPNGYVEVWTGLLLRAEDEAELAFVLGHETAHYAENHSLAAHEALKTRANIGMALAFAIGSLGYLASLSTMFGFDRAQEAQADSLGFQRAVTAGYRPTGGADLWKTVMAETAASDFDKVRKSDARFNVFDTHPATAERLAALQTAAKGRPDGDAGADRLRAAIRPFLGSWLKTELLRRDYGETLYLLDRLSRSEQDLGVINFYRGEVYRTRRADGDLDRAMAAYALAATYPDAPVAAWRELGEARNRAHDEAGAKDAFQAYLSKAPSAEDAWMVQDAMQSLAKKDGP